MKSCEQELLKLEEKVGCLEKKIKEKSVTNVLSLAVTVSISLVTTIEISIPNFSLA